MKILFLSNDLSRTGAPLVLLNFLKWLDNNNSDVIADVIALDGGIMENEFKKYCRRLFLLRKNLIKKIIIHLFPKFLSESYFNTLTLLRKLDNYDIVYANTVVTIPLAVCILNNNNNIKSVLHIHELEYAINYHIKNLEKYINKIDHFIAVSEKVKNNIIKKYLISNNKVTVIYPPTVVNEISEFYENKSKFIVGGSGHVRWEKGFDLFILLVTNVKKKCKNEKIQFSWVGHFSDNDLFKYTQEIIKAGINDIVSLEGEVPFISEKFSNFDVFVLTSREDPFPLVCIEAGMLGKPIICFEGASGTQEILQFGGGFIVPYLDIEAMAEKIIYYYNNRDLLIKDGQRSKELFSQFTPENQYPKNFEVISKVLNLP